MGEATGPVERVAVVGCGLMGAGIVEVCARAGATVRVLEVDDAGVAAGRSRLEGATDRSVRSGRLTDDERATLLGRTSFTTQIEDLADSDLVIEAALEDVDLKLALFRSLDRVVERPDALLSSNTSSIPISRLARVTDRPEQVVGLHFFNPVPILPLVEVVRSLLTSDETNDRAATYARDVLGKTVIECGDRAGFVVNILLVPYLLSAIRLHESGFASVEDIDAGMVHGANHPNGPLRVADFIGLDTLLDVSRVLYEEFKDPAYAAPPLLARMVDSGLTGRKAGRGFYDHRR